MKRFSMRRMIVSGAAILALAPVMSTAQNVYPAPSKPVRIIVGFPAGTGPDIVARLLAQNLTQIWGGAGVIVDNKPGAGGLIAASEAARASPDGYTLMLGETGQLSIAPSSYNRLPYDPQKDFFPVSQVVTSDFALLVNPQKITAKTAQDFVKWTKQQPGFFMATFGAGTPGHFGAFMFGDAAGLKPEAVHYKSTADALGGVFSGDVQGVFASMGLATPNVKAGKLVALGTSGSSRTHSLPEVPTLKEQGLSDLVFNTWFGVVAPANTPLPIVEQLQQDIVKAMHLPEGKKRMEDAGFEVTGTTSEAFKQIIQDDTVKWAKAVKATGFKAD